MGDFASTVSEVEVTDCGDGSVTVVVRFEDNSQVRCNVDPDPEGGEPEVVRFQDGRRLR